MPKASTEFLIGDIVRLKNDWKCSTEDLEGIIVNDKVQLKVLGFAEFDSCAVEGNGFSPWINCDKLTKIKK